ncbi:MAG: cation:proton antiporter [Candidatus Micrarchaeota archaeon]|nr:cation:proton antiporter [Candidatus Micrarchaeota archaeon]
MDAPLAVGISVTVIMLFALFFDRFRLPTILGVLLAGIIIGPSSPLAGAEVLGIRLNNIMISDPSLVSLFALIGSALILFGIGLEFSAIKLVQLGLFTFLSAILKVLLVYLSFFAFFSLLGMDAPAAALVSIALSFSSTPIVVKLLEASGKSKRQESSFIISILIIEDLLVVFFLGLIANPPISFTDYSFVISLVRVLLTFVFAYFVLSKVISRFLSLISHSDELLILASVSLALLIGYFSEWIGLSFSVGAFLAGSTIAGSAEARRIEEKIRPFSYLFAAFFFFSIGLAVNVHAVARDVGFLAIFVVLGLVVRFFAAGIPSYLSGYNGRSAAFCAIYLLPMSELSLLLLSQGVSAGLVSEGFLGNFAFAIILSSFVSAWLSGKENEAYKLVIQGVPLFFIKNLRLVRSTAIGIRRAISESYRYYHIIERLPPVFNHSEQLSAREQMSLAGKNSVLFAAASAVSFFFIFLSQFQEWKFIDQLFFFFFLLFFASSALFLVNLHSAVISTIKMLLRGRRGEEYSTVLYFLGGVSFIFLAVLYCLAYFSAPLALSPILALPALAFAAKCLASAARSLHYKEGL